MATPGPRCDGDPCRRRRRPTLRPARLDQLPLESVVVRAAEGEDRAWREIERRYRRLAEGVARQLGVRAADVPDVVQHVWVQLFRSLPRLREPAHLAAWIRTTTRREAMRLVRRQGRQVLAEDVEELGGRPPVQRDAIDEAIVRHDLVCEVRRAAREMTPRCRALMGVLLADPSCSYQEISERLGWPVGSIGPTRARAFGSLRRHGRLQPAGL